MGIAVFSDTRSWGLTPLDAPLMDAWVNGRWVNPGTSIGAKNQSLDDLK
jgi:hypothetical protein